MMPEDREVGFTDPIGLKLSIRPVEMLPLPPDNRTSVMLVCFP